MRRTLLTLALALPLLSACASGGLKPRYDRVAGTTGLTQQILDTSGGLSSGRFPMRITAYYGWRGQGAPAPAQAAFLNFTAWPRTAAGWQWLNNNRLQVLVDGEQRATYNGRYDSEIQQNNLYEHVVYQIPTTDLEVMANATRVEGRVGTRDFVLEGEELTRLREFVTYIRGGSGR